ncbi:DUF3291 domain-containing protein [Stappia sp. MMSF_3263]|uniref:DUF3291 domain-containing protein n=1 Tax=Stappia sp. MMSF_3263 TaxID=3046693 RepID=UPI00273D055B|nr:DUF3291 domain-containing protein [Stappia sp. MMSF_3263]
MHVAQFNISKPRHRIDSPRMAGFVNSFDRVNAAADRSPGFVWRYVATGADAAALPRDGDDEVIANLSLWKTVADLENYVRNTVHRQVYDMREHWFADLGRPHFVMWLVPEGHRPTMEEAFGRLGHLRRHGDSDHAFGWDGLPHIERWLEARHS